MNKKIMTAFSIKNIKKKSRSARYRILLLTSVPILTSLIILVVITLYWALSYTWENTIHEISTRLHIAQNSFKLIKKNQESDLELISQSYKFQKYLSHKFDAKKINRFLKKLNHTYDVNYITFHYITNHKNDPQLHYGTYFDVFDATQLKEIDTTLSQRARIPLYNENYIESRGLILRTVIPVVDQHFNIVGYLDSGLLINNSSQLVDELRELIYPSTRLKDDSKGTVTIFLFDHRISTNVFFLHPDPSSGKFNRAIGTKVSDEVAEAVLHRGNEWIGITTVVNAWYIAAYQPIKNVDGNVIGIIYTGYPIWSFLKNYIINIMTLFFAAIFLLLISTYFVLKTSSALFLPLEKMGEVVRKIRIGEKTRIGDLGLNDGHELTLLAKEFDHMLNNLEESNKEISSLVSDLEIKIKERTEKLEVKTKQLEHHIKLLNQTRNKLIAQEKFAALGVLTAGIAHEINNPVAVILGNTELIKRSILNDNLDVLDETTVIFEQIERIKGIVYSLLQYSKSPNPKMKPTIQNINDIVYESIKLTNTGTNKRNIKFVINCQATVKIIIDHHQLLQVLINLELNAIDAMENGGVITITTYDLIENDDITGIIIEVQDQGCGITDKDINRIFDPFYTTKKEGTGLGLAVSNSIISHIGGEISVSSNNIGSSFKIFLPTNIIS